jgi:thiol-disulfide isomerase/thioredoxin
LAERYGVKRYPVVFVNEAMVARPEDFGGWGATTGKYHPWKSPANQAKFKKDLARMIDLTLRGRAPAPNEVQAQAEAVGEIAALPPLDLRDIEGRRIESANLADRVVIVEFWATWCPPCRSTLGWLGEVFGTISSVPTMFVFDRQGKTATVFYGAPEDLHQKAERLLNSLVK